MLDGRSAPIEIHADVGATVHIGCGALIEGGTSLEAQEEVTIGSGARISRFVKIIDSHFHPLRRDGSSTPPPLALVIGPGVVIEAGAVVMRGARVEPGARVLARAVVSRRVPAGTVYQPGLGAGVKEPKPAADSALARDPALRVPSALGVVMALLRARMLFRGCRTGVRIRAGGYVRVIPTGDIALGDRVTFLGGMVPTELVAHEGAELSIGSSSVVNYGSSFEACRSIRIGSRCWIASFVRIADRGWHGTAPVTVGDDVWIAHGATIEPGVNVGNQSVIAAGSVVTQDVPPQSLAIGNPARCVRLDLVAPSQGTARVLGR